MDQLEKSRHASAGAALRESYARDGAVLVEGFLDEHELGLTRSAFDFCIENPTAVASAIAMIRKQKDLEAGVETTHETVVDLANPAAKDRLEDLVAAIPFGEFLADLWGSENVWYYGEELFKKTGGTAPRTLWHQDTAYMPIAGSHWANVWISFEAVPQSNALEIVKGSHRGVQYDGTTFNREDPTQPWHGGDALPRLPDIDADLARDPHAHEIVSWATSVGDVVVLHPRSLHGGAGLDAAFQARNTLVLRFFGDDATLRLLPSPSASGFPPLGGLYGADLAHLAEGDPYRSPIFKKVY